MLLSLNEVFDKLIKLKEVETAIQFARDFVYKIEKRVGVRSYYFWKAKEKLIDLLVKLEREKQAHLEAKDCALELEKKAGY